MSNPTAQNTAFSRNYTLNVQGRLIDLTRPAIMGILNVTPDSFFDGGRYWKEPDILKQVEKMTRDGATFIDVGGYSSRPGAPDIPVHEELQRVGKTIRAIKKEFPYVILTIDTFRSTVARAAVEEGASMINDISGGELDPGMPETVAALNVPYIFMHMKGTPQTMHQHTSYTNLIKEVTDYFHKKILRFHQLGVRDLVIDPGFGFAKTIEQNYHLLNHLDHLQILEKPILAGLSRKSMIWKTLGIAPAEALNGTTALNALALLKGASILRVHDVKEAKEVITLLKALH